MKHTYYFLGMSMQAFITGSLIKTGAINATSGQQLMSSVFFLVTALLAYVIFERKQIDKIQADIKL